MADLDLNLLNDELGRIIANQRNYAPYFGVKKRKTDVMSVNNFTYSTAGRNLTETFEGCQLTAYQDGNGIWTIGYGHTAGVQPGDTCTQAQADAWLEQDIQWAASVVNSQVTVALTQTEFDALCDFVYNCGSGNFEKSTLLKDLNAGNFSKVAADMAMWDKAAGQVCAGLLRRREAEGAEFNA